MTETQIQIMPEDLANAEDVDWTEAKEFWNEYKLKDGTTLKVRLILIAVKRLKKYLPDGNPMYFVNSSNVVRAVDIPKELKMKPKASNLKVT